MLMLALLLAGSASTLVSDVGEDDPEAGSAAEGLAEPVVRHLVADPDSIQDLGTPVDGVVERMTRAERADGLLASFDRSGYAWYVDVPAPLRASRADLLLIVLDGDVPHQVVWDAVAADDALALREQLPPSGIVVQGDAAALARLAAMPWVVASAPAPLAFVVEPSLLAAWAAEPESLAGASVWLDGWRADDGRRLAAIQLGDLQADLGQAARTTEAARWLDSGRLEGDLLSTDLAALAAEPALAWLQFEPRFELDNDQARGHLAVSGSGGISTAFTTDLNGSGEIVAVADAGLDEDHGDFGTRIIGTVDSIGDGSTADTNTGHGTHVSCTVLGDGMRSSGQYAGGAPQAELYFQALENDATGQFFSPSLFTLINQAHGQGARTHTNSWGGQTGQGSYSVSSEDVDARMNWYDRVDAGREGITVLFASGNDGSDSGSVGTPATAKNVVTVGSVWNRGGAAPSTIVSTSSRGPTDDGRIKPDVVAPGGRVRSCLAQEAQNTNQATWTSTWYMENSGTSMATPNAAAVATLVREYLTEVAVRPEPQGALVKALLILGARDIGTRDIPNNTEGWGLIDAVDSLNPSLGRGIWVDDRQTLTYGNSKTYNFNVSESQRQFKVVLAWSDWRGSRQAQTQLMNDLNLIVEAPDGTLFLGNDFANGRSTTGGTADDLNSVEVVLVDQAAAGLWQVTIENVDHRGQGAQPFAVAVSAVGANDLRPDPAPVPGTLAWGEAIPQVDEPLTLRAQVRNLGNIVAHDVVVEISAQAQILSATTLDLGPGESRWVTADWTPTQAGDTELIVWVDRNDTLDEISQANNEFRLIVNVTAPGVRVDADSVEKVLPSASTQFISWNLTLTNTALIATDASVTAAKPVQRSTGTVLNSWFVGFNQTNASLGGGNSTDLLFTLGTGESPEPGEYDIVITGYDVQNGVTFPLQLTLVVPTLAAASLQRDWTGLEVSPLDQTNLSVRLLNQGNAPQGFDLRLESPLGWTIGLASLGSIPGAPQGSSGLIDTSGQVTIDLVVTPPSDRLVAAGTSLVGRLIATSQVDTDRSWTLELPLTVAVHLNSTIDLESSLGAVQPDAVLPLQFSLTNLGNVEALYSASVSAPGGWSVTPPADLTVSSGDTGDFVVTLRGNGLAAGGTLEVRMDADSGERTTWTGQLVIVSAADVQVVFSELALADGQTATSPAGLGGVPGGESFALTWTATNLGDAPWSGTTSLVVPTSPLGFVASCTPDQTTITVSGQVLVRCSLEVPIAQPGGTDVSVTLVLDDGASPVTHPITLRVKAAPALEWTFTGQVPAVWVANEAVELEWEVENVGNAPVDHVVVLTTPAGWEAEVVGSSQLSLAPGASRLVRVSVSGSDAEAGDLVVALRSGDGVSNSSTTLALARLGGGSGGVLGGVDATTASLAGLALVLVIGLLGLVVLARGRGGSKGTGAAAAGSGWMPPPPPPEMLASIATPPSDLSATLPPPEPVNTLEADPNHRCWVCLQGLAGATWKACASCGARYHGDPGCGVEALTGCRNCGAATGTFVAGS